jgi:hypothetical protein
MDTILQLLDDLEKELSALRSLSAATPIGGYAAVEPSLLRSELELAGLTASELGRIIDVSREEVEAWLAARTPTPAWALTTVQLTALLAPSVRRKLLRQPLGQAIQPKPKSHPFSRIEDL